MRFLPILLPVFMLAPIAIWLGIEIFVIQGSALRWLSGNLFEVISLGAITLAVCVFFSVWVGNNIARTLKRR